jgi:hypothetical protein
MKASENIISNEYHAISLETNEVLFKSESITKVQRLLDTLFDAKIWWKPYGWHEGKHYQHSIWFSDKPSRVKVKIYKPGDGVTYNYDLSTKCEKCGSAMKCTEYGDWSDVFFESWDCSKCGHNTYNQYDLTDDKDKATYAQFDLIIKAYSQFRQAKNVNGFLDYVQAIRKGNNNA